MSLDRLSPMEPVQQDPPSQLPSTDPQRLHQMQTRSQNKASQSSLDRHGRRDHSPKRFYPRFRMNERVVVHNKQGVGIHGAVRWTEEVFYAGDKLMGVGIETVRCYFHFCVRIQSHIIFIILIYTFNVIYKYIHTIHSLNFVGYRSPIKRF